MTELATGDVVWVGLEPIRGREKGGHRPVVVVSSPGCLDVVTMLVIVVPVTSVSRGWPNHVPLTGPIGLAVASLAMTEQVRTIARERITGRPGRVDDTCLSQIRTWVDDFLALQAPSGD